MANVDMLTKVSFGHYGSTYVPASTTLDLSGATSTHYITTILIVEDNSSFSALESLNGQVGMLSTVTAENDLDGTNGIGATSNGTSIASIQLKTGMVLFGKWDKLVTNASSTCICYFAPKGY
tara:strand:- start:869 stop:1234 length:366 start_codon:yes stop_codon:yes gene_type:complete